MSIKHYLISASILVLGSSAFAQATYKWSPRNTGTVPGGASNPIPFWGKSSTYQQVHEKATMGAVVTIKGMGFRPATSTKVLGRSWDMRLTMSHTKVTAAATTAMFSMNLGSTSTMVFGTATSWPTFSWKDFTMSGLKPAFTIPFNSTYIYVSSLGNLCWEWRWRNATVADFPAMDACNGLREKGLTLASVGTGCTATGKTGPATATMVAVPFAGRSYQNNLEVALTNAANSANAMLALGASNTTTAIGWCAPVITPLVLLPVTTDSTGSFRLKQSLATLSGSASFKLYAQFGFTDTGLPAQIGLSNVAGYTTPNVPGANGIARWFAYNRTGNGGELATTASGGQAGYGLATAWLQ
jgi:hypothetical protein